MEAGTPGALARRSCGKLLLEGSYLNGPLGLCIPGPCLAASSSSGGRACLALLGSMLASQCHPTGRLALVASHCPPENQSYPCECSSFERLPLETSKGLILSVCFLSDTSPRTCMRLGPGNCGGGKDHFLMWESSRKHLFSRTPV